MSAPVHAIAVRLKVGLQSWLGCGCVWILVAIQVASGQGSEPSNGFEELPLPTWSSEEWRRAALESAPPMLGGLLPGLGEGTEEGPLGTNPVVTPRFPDGPPTVFGDVNSLRDGLSLFLPEGLASTARFEASSEGRRPTPLMQLKDVTPEFLAAAANWPDDDLLIDPGAELAETQAEDLRRFLGYHAEESRIPIRVVLLARDEKLPALSSTELTERLGGGNRPGQRSALLVYPLGEPWRARLFLPSAAHQAVSAAYLSRLFEACLTAAAATSQADGQLHEFVVQLSIRLFWLEKELAQKKSDALAPMEADASHPALSEVGVDEPQAKFDPAAVRPPHPSLELPPASFASVAVLLGLLLVLGGRRLLRGFKKAAHERLHRQIWMLPDHEAESRLGGAFCGGGGAWGSWK